MENLNKNVPNITKYQERYTSSQKEIFRREIQKSLKCGEKFKEQILDKKRFSLHRIFNSKYYKGEKYTNLYYIPHSCKIIFTAHYDTPRRKFLVMKLLDSLERFFGPLGKFLVLLLILVLPSLVILISAITELTTLMGVMTIFLLVFIVIMLFDFFVVKVENPYNMNDNTSGVVALMHIINLINNCYNDFGFIFFDGEEDVLSGSRGFVKNPPKYSDSNETINLDNKIIINLDCVNVVEENEVLIISTNFRNMNTYRVLYNLIEKLKEQDIINIKEKTIKKRYMNTDYVSFKNSSSISLGVYEKAKFYGYCLKYIHTKNDREKISSNYITSLVSAIINSVTMTLEKDENYISSN